MILSNAKPRSAHVPSRAPDATSSRDGQCNQVRGKANMGLSPSSSPRNAVLLEMIVEAEPDQISKWRRQMCHLVTVKSICVKRQPVERVGVRMLIEVVPGMAIPTRTEIQRLATENNVLLRHCRPVDEEVKALRSALVNAPHRDDG
jgi:hypothetical protein